jgi:hypothetical protein
VVDFAIVSHARAVAVLLVVSLLAFLPGFFSIPPIDRDEARFAQATKQMLETGDYVDIRFQDEVRYKKPVGIYWLQAAAVKAASALGFQRALTTIWLYRIPSLVGAVGTVLLTYWAALAFVSRRAAVLAGLMMASCVLLGIERLIAKTDAMLVMAVVVAMGALARVYNSAAADEGLRIAAMAGPCRPCSGPHWLRASQGAADHHGGRAYRLTLAIVDRSRNGCSCSGPLSAWCGSRFWSCLGLSPSSRARLEFFADRLGRTSSARYSRRRRPRCTRLLFGLILAHLLGAMLAALAPARLETRHQPATKFLWPG